MCGNAPVVPYAAMNSYDTLPGTVITYNCLFGYSFPDGAISKTATCDSSSLQWQLDPGQSLSDYVCIREYAPSHKTGQRGGIQRLRAGGLMCFIRFSEVLCREAGDLSPHVI